MTSEHTTMIEAIAPVDHIRQSYNRGIAYYGQSLAARSFERKPCMLGLEHASIQPHDKVLEVAVGPGRTLFELVKRVDRANVVYGVDLAPRMLEKTRRLIGAAGYTNIDLREADARQLPFPDSMFDVLYNGYMLDLIPLSDMIVVLNEFKRVLKPGGRLVLVNFSKEEKTTRTIYERLYQQLPAPWVPYVLGGCRPVLMESTVKQAGFCNVQRKFVPNIIPSEVVMAEKPKTN